MKHASAAILLTLIYGLVACLVYDNPGARARLTMDAENLVGNSLYAVTVGIQLVVKYLILTAVYCGCLATVAVHAMAAKRRANDTEP